ncbi:MAG: hypothetical protein WD646_08800 [Actinomycetota bacterium]
MTRRVYAAITAGIALWLMPAIAAAQAEDGEIKPNLNWVFLLSIVVALGFLAFLFFVALYYVLAVIARNRKFATPVVVAAAPVPAAAVGAPAPAAAAAPVASAAPAPAAAPAAAPASAPARPPAPAVPAGTGGVPKIDPNNLPDGIDAVTRGRLKKLAVLQERGQEPPADLLTELKTVLDQMGGGSAAPAAAPAEAPPAAPAEAAPPAEAPPVAEAAPAAEPAPAAPPADTGGLPRIDPNNLPDGIDAVTRGRLKKLAVLQERGDTPSADLVEKLKPVLDQMG